MNIGSNGAELDDIDKAIIRALQDDGRLPYAQLSPIVGLSEAATRQRVNRLIDRGVMSIVAVTDPARLGLQFQAMLGVNVNGDVKVVAGQLAAMNDVRYTVIVTGRYDILAEVVCIDAERLLDLVNDRIRPIDGVSSVETMTYLRLVSQSYDWGTG